MLTYKKDYIFYNDELIGKVCDDCIFIKPDMNECLFLQELAWKNINVSSNRLVHQTYIPLEKIKRSLSYDMKRIKALHSVWTCPVETEDEEFKYIDALTLAKIEPSLLNNPLLEKRSFYLYPLFMFLPKDHERTAWENNPDSVFASAALSFKAFGITLSNLPLLTSVTQPEVIINRKTKQITHLWEYGNTFSEVVECYIPDNAQIKIWEH